MRSKRIITLVISAMVIASFSPIEKVVFAADFKNEKLERKEGEIVSSTFDHYYDSRYYKRYEDKFRVNGIKSYSTNGGEYRPLKNLFDGDLESFWESNNGNIDGGFKNEVIITFNNIEDIGRIAYATRGGGFGSPKKMSIYASLTDDEEDFKLVGTGTSEAIDGILEFRFDSTKFKRLKIVFDEIHYSPYASATELLFFKEDLIGTELKDMFTDNTKVQLSIGYDKNRIDILSEHIQGHPFSAEYERDIELAKELLEDPNKYISTVRSFDSRGDSVKESQKRKMGNFKDLQPTGYTVNSGQVINVYLDAPRGEPLPVLVFKQPLTTENGLEEIVLERGRNRIVIPFAIDGSLEGTTKGGSLYVSNAYTTKEQSRKPKIRIEGAQKYPIYIDGESNDEEVMEQLEAYVKKVKENKNVPDIFDVVTEQSVSMVTATYALQWYKDNKKLPSYTATRWEETADKSFAYWGYDGSSEINTLPNLKITNMTKNMTSGYMHALDGVNGVGIASQDVLLSGDTGWGMIHELGHNMDTRNRKIGEITNNILPIMIAASEGVATRITTDNKWDSAIYPQVAKENIGNNIWQSPNGDDSLRQLAPLWQLNLYDKTFYPKFEQYYRANNVSFANRDEIAKSWVKVSSDILELDLYEFFERHGIYAGNSVKESVSKYPKPNKKIQYLNDRVYTLEKSEFTEDMNFNIDSVKKEAEGNRLNFSIDNANKNKLLGYEIFRDGKLIGFTSSDSYLDKLREEGINHTYEVIAYDLHINPSDKKVAKAFKPTLSVEENVTLKLKDEYNPMDYIKSSSYDGDDISEKVIIKSNNVDTSKKGIYEVVYEITDNESTEIKTSKVEVTSNYIYASDIKEVSSKVEYRNLEKDKNPLGEQISLIRQGIVSSYKKGLGAHANSEIIYNIEDNNIDYFESYIGIDQSISGSKASATFEVWADGTKIYESGVFKDNTEHEFIKVPVTGAKEVKLITTDAKDGNGSDHTVWADAKFTINSAKPEIDIPDSISTKVGEVIDLGVYSAYDMEDGDLTDSVIVEGTVDFNKSGEYTLTYKVKDSDNNETIKTRTIAVVDMKYYNYLTNYDWKSANNSYGKAQKDKSASNNTLRLTNEEGIEVAYERGIGTHANSTIIYDLSDKNYDYFTSYVGVDRAMFGTVGSVTFQVLVDNVVKFDSGLMNSRDKQKYIEVDINGAKELKLIVTDGGNGNGSDHATWGDTKVYSAKVNSKPIIEIPNNISIKLNEEYNLMEGVQATDEEDGDITTNVVVDKGDFTTTKAGEYIIKYTITDSAGNSTSKELTIIVYSDEKYISDVEWQSTTTTFKDVKKDTALGGGKIKLNVDGKETIFKKGLGTHANAEIVYDVENMDYEYFETYVGIDRNIKEQSKSSVVFKIFADDVEVYNSGIMKWSDDAKFARVSLKGISKLTLVANDSGNGNESDHSLFANSRFLTTVEIDRSNLDALLKEVDELEESNYIAETWNNLMTVKEKVNVSLSDGYNQKEIDSLYEELKIAKDNLKVVANYDSLIALVESTKELKDYIYTQKSWSILLESITNAETMIADKNTTTEEVNLMIEELTASINNLEVRSDKVELEKLLNFADTITDISFVGASKHQEARWNNFVTNREIARKSLTDVDITVDQGNKIVFELQYFIDELQMK